MEVDVVRRLVRLALPLLLVFFIGIALFMGLQVSFEAFGGSVDEAADVTSVLLLQVVDLLVLLVELLKLECPRTLLASELKVAHCGALKKISSCFYCTTKTKSPSH